MIFTGREDTPRIPVSKSFYGGGAVSCSGALRASAAALAGMFGHLLIKGGCPLLYLISRQILNVRRNPRTREGNGKRELKKKF